MTNLPDPPIPADVSCKGLPYMPLKVVELMESDLAELSSGTEFKAAVLLWCKSWVQVPAGSLPNDDRRLAKYAGVSLEQFDEIKSMALRGWIACSDGNIYHPIICDLALAAWKTRKTNQANATARWATETRKNAIANAAAPLDPSGRTEKPMRTDMQVKVREGKVREESPKPPNSTDAIASKPTRPKPSDLIFEVFVGENKFDISLDDMLADLTNEKPVQRIVSAAQRKSEARFISVGILRCLGADPEVAVKTVAQAVSNFDLSPEELEKSALQAWAGRPGRPIPYFASVCERIAAERRN